MAGGPDNPAKTTDPDVLIAQLTDLHLGFDRTLKTGPNVLRLRRVLEALHGLRRRPDLMLLTGDLVESGENWAYALLKGELAKSEIPFALALGNHDNRETFEEHFPDFPLEDGYLNYVIEDTPLRIVVIDTMEPGRHGGAFGADRADWLERTLAAKPGRPTLIALHHPPIATHIPWMTPDADEAWTLRLRAIVERHPQIVGLVSGHVHCHIQSLFAGRVVTVSRAVAPSVALEMDPIDPKTPDDRRMIVNEDPGYTLHHWNGQDLTSFSQIASDGKVLVRYDADHAFIPAITMDLAERER
ncbi:MAG: metallophosphoesterase [Litorimonas sp.]